MERAVVFISLDDYQVAPVGQKQIAIVIQRYASEKSVAVDTTLSQQVSYHRRDGSFAVGSCDTQAAFGLGNFAQYLGSFVNSEIIFSKKTQLLVFGWNSRSIDNYCLLRVFEFGVDIATQIVVVYIYALCLQFGTQVATYSVVTTYFKTSLPEVPGDSTHSDATDTEKIIISHLRYNI